ncbi:hypothetical protein J3E72DRAFT_271532 [Bipolaris maydis]|nr:hypothetical protein J3E72DRAFT_271532 [Bipolaris maydis]
MNIYTWLLTYAAPSGDLQSDLVMVNSASDATVKKASLNEIELQKAWDALAERSDGATVIVPETFGRERGILPESPRVTRNGVSGFLVTLDSMHQAHCVDAAWRRLWFNHEDDKLNGPMAKYNISDQWYKDHITHCLKILKQSILCKMNIDMVMGYIQWNRSNPDDFIHFEKNHIFPASHRVWARMGSKASWKNFNFQREISSV